MKQFIVLMAVLPILVLFMLQFMLDQKNHDNIGRLQEYVYTAKEQAKQKGCFTWEIRKEMVDKIKESFQIEEGEMVLILDDVPRYRTTGFDERELIHYQVSVPIKKIMAGHRFFGISDEQNRGMYTIENWTASELLREF